jgi:AAA domain
MTNDNDNNKQELRQSAMKSTSQSNPDHLDDPILSAGGIAKDFQPEPPRQGPIDIADLMDIEFPPLKWIVENILPEGLTLLAGPSKIGKSWLVLDLALAVSTGNPFLGDTKVKKGGVLYWALEDSRRRIQDRINQLHSFMFADWEGCNLKIETAENLPSVLDQGGLELLKNWCENNPDPCLIIIDVLEKVRPERKGNASEYEAIYKGLQGLHTLAASTGISIVVVHHTRKGGGDGDPFDEVSGTRALTSMPDATLVLKRGNNGFSDAILYGRGRDLMEFDLALDFSDCTWNILGENDTINRSKERADLLKLLDKAPEGMGPKDIATQLRKTEGSVSSLLRKMTTSHEVKKLGRGLYVAVQE